MPVYVQHETLRRVGDVFDAEALWQAPGLALFARRPLLRDLLERTPREQRGRAATRCFSHVTLMLPQDEVDDDRHLTRGARVRDLAQTLQALHQKDFGDLLGADEVRYHVLGSSKLEPGQVDVKFGHAVYLPAPGETALYTVSVSRDSAIWEPVCPVYPNGRLTVLGPDSAASTHAVPGWPFAADAAILLINDGPDTPPEVQVRPKDAFDCGFDAAAGYYTIRARRTDGAAGPARLLLKLTPTLAQAAVPPAQGAPARAQDHAGDAARPASVWKARARPVDDVELTAVPAMARATPILPPAALDATYAPVSRSRIALAALALPRLSRYRDTGAAAVEFGIDRKLAVGAVGGENLIGFAVDAADGIHVLGAGGRQPIAVPSRFAPLDGVEVQVLAPAPAMAERYRALVRLPGGPAAAVEHGVPLDFGRGTAALAALRVLDAPTCLRAAGGADLGGADRLGLSRTALRFEAGPDGCRVSRLAPAQALYHLDEALGFVATIEAAPGEQAYLVPFGHHIVAGHYVLRVEA